MINAIVLAAGESRRMGKLKPLLRFRDTTFLEQIISVLKLSDVDRVTVVLGARAETIKKSIDLSGTDVVVNKDYRKGQLSSLVAGLKNTPAQMDAILVCLVDNPFITKTVVNRIISKFKETKGPIVVPVFNKKRGHPTLFSRSLFKELLNAPAQEGARYVVYSNKEKMLELEMPESGILVSIDTPEDYKFHFGARP
jgi:CTP:molybdopterin cytidylyltransferase MocA